MMARLEEAEHGDLARMREWLDRATAAAPDPRWVCASCGGESLEWRSLCPRCGSFDALAWQTPVWPASGGIATARIATAGIATAGIAAAGIATAGEDAALAERRPSARPIAEAGG